MLLDRPPPPDRRTARLVPAVPNILVRNLNIICEYLLKTRSSTKSTGTLSFKDKIFYPEIGWLSNDDGEVKDNPEEDQGPHFPRSTRYCNDPPDPPGILFMSSNASDLTS